MKSSGGGGGDDVLSLVIFFNLKTDSQQIPTKISLEVTRFHAAIEINWAHGSSVWVSLK